MRDTDSTGHSRMQSSRGTVTLCRRALIRHCARNSVMTLAIASLFLNTRVVAELPPRRTTDEYKHRTITKESRDRPAVDRSPTKFSNEKPGISHGDRTKRLIKHVVQSRNILIHLHGNSFATPLKGRIHYAPMMYAARTMPAYVSGTILIVTSLRFRTGDDHLRIDGFFSFVACEILKPGTPCSV